MLLNIGISFYYLKKIKIKLPSKVPLQIMRKVINLDRKQLKTNQI